jgi:hypothetical protein
VSALALLLTVALAAALAGCGGSSGNGIASKSDSEILAASIAAAEAASSVHVAVHNSQGRRLSVTLNLDLARNGARASISVLDFAYELIRIGDTLYVKGNPAFYRQLGGAVRHAPQGRWLKASTSGGQLAGLASLTESSSELERLLSSRGPITKGATTTVNGQKAIELKESAKLFSGSLFIATTGKPYPIELLKRGRETGQTTFSHWNAPVSLTAPPNAIAVR